MAAAKQYTSAVLNHYIGTRLGKKLQWVARWNVVNCSCCNLIGTTKFRSQTHIGPKNLVVIHQTLLPRGGVGSGHETIKGVLAAQKIYVTTHILLTTPTYGCMYTRTRSLAHVHYSLMMYFELSKRLTHPAVSCQ